MWIKIFVGLLCIFAALVLTIIGIAAYRVYKGTDRLSREEAARAGRLRNLAQQDERQASGLNVKEEIGEQITAVKKDARTGKKEVI